MPDHKKIAPGEILVAKMNYDGTNRGNEVPKGQILIALNEIYCDKYNEYCIDLLAGDELVTWKRRTLVELINSVHRMHDIPE